MDPNPPTWQMVKTAVEALGGKARNSQILQYVQAHWPKVNPGTVTAHIAVCTVNSLSRVQYAQNSRPRIANGRYDFLYKLDRGIVELYDPKRHGSWEIRKRADGRLEVGELASGGGTDDGSEDGDEGEVDGGTEATDFLFPLERHLRDFLAKNIRSVSAGGKALTLYTHDNGQVGIEYPTAVGPIDILAVDAEGNFFVFELKLGRGPDAAIGQLARYMGWVKCSLVGDRQVTGVIVAKTVDDKLRYAASVIPNAVMLEYSMSFALHPATAVGSGQRPIAKMQPSAQDSPVPSFDA